MGISVYLVPHTFDCENPLIDSDDLQASKDICYELKNTAGVYIIDSDINAPQIKYIISKFDFFIGSRMHANFAAIYTQVPVFGLAYSYKFAGSFDLYGLQDNYFSVLNLNKHDVTIAVAKIFASYYKRKKPELFL